MHHLWNLLKFARYAWLCPFFIYLLGVGISVIG
jgi:hypothetical protein